MARQMYTSYQILQILDEAARERGRPLSSTEWAREHRLPTVYTIRRHFGTWDRAWELAGWQHGKVASREKALEVMRQAYIRFGRIPSRREWDEAGYWPRASVITRRFGGWKKTWQEAVGEQPAYPPRRAPFQKEAASLPAHIVARLRLDREEQQILWLIARGVSYAEIGRKLGVSRQAIQLRANRLRRMVQRLVQQEAR